MEPDWDRINSLITEQSRWANLSVTIREIAKNNKSLVRDMSNYDPDVTVPFLAGLLTMPVLQSNYIRLEILIVLATVYCRGSKKATIKKVIRWFSQIGKSQCVLGEDPAEDVFVSIVHENYGDYLILEGGWESAGFYTQRVLDVVMTMPDTDVFRKIKRSAKALLVISDIVCKKAGLYRYQLGSDIRNTKISNRMLRGRRVLVSNVTIFFSELKKRGIVYADIEPFLFSPQMRMALPSQRIGQSYLERCPLIAHGDIHLTVSLPSALSIAVRDYVISQIIMGGHIETFNEVLTKMYSNLFFDIPMLGGPMHAPVYWKKLGAYRLAALGFEFDAGCYISYHFFLPSIKIHLSGGFKDYFQDEGFLSEAL
jgi:hypothetical protein